MSGPELNAAFAAVVAGLSTDARFAATWPNTVGTQQPDPNTPSDRTRRRDERRAEREFELAAFQAEQAEIEALHAADEEHYVPPPPPPIPRMRRRTAMALALIACGIVVLAVPGMLAIPPDAAVILGGLLILSGGGMLFAGLRRRRSTDADGWDDGAEL